MSFFEGADEALESRVGGKYRLVARLGAGTLGTVFEAEHSPYDGIPLVYHGTELPADQRVALKMFHPHLVPFTDQAFAERFLQGLKALARISHPVIVNILDYGMDGEMVYVISPFLPGTRVKEVLQSSRSLSLKQILAILSPVCQALQYAHQRGIYHLGLSTDNISIERRGADTGAVQLFDLGLTGLLLGEGKVPVLDESGGVVSIPRHVAPEQVLGYPGDARSDTYALGGILYDMLVGPVSFDQDLLLQTTMCHLNQYPILEKRFTPAADLPDAVTRVVTTALEGDTKRRYQSVEAFLSALIEAVEEVESAEAVSRAKAVLNESDSATDAQVPISFPPLQRRRGIVKVGTVALFCLFFGLVVLPSVQSLIGAYIEDSESEMANALRRSVIKTRAEVKDLFDALERERSLLERLLSEIRAEIALHASAPMPLDPKERLRKTWQLDHLKEVVRFRDQQSQVLITTILNKNRDFIDARKHFDEAERMFRKGEYETATVGYARAAELTQRLARRAELVRSVFDARVSLSETVRRWKSEQEQATTLELPKALASAIESADSALGAGRFDAARDEYGAIRTKLEEMLLAKNPFQRPESTPEPQATAAPTAEPVRVLPTEEIRALVQAEKYKEAVPKLRAALEHVPDDVSLRTLLGRCLYQLRRFGEAIVELKTVLNADPKFAEAHYHIANSYLFLERFEDARTHFEQVLTLTPDNSTARLNYGATLEKLGERPAAIAAYQAVLAKEPGNALAKSNLARLQKRSR